MVEVTHKALSDERGEQVVVEVTEAQARHMAAKGWELVKQTKAKKAKDEDGES